MFIKIQISVALLTVLGMSHGLISAFSDRARDNGDIFIINYDSFDGDVDDISTTTQAPREAGYIDFDEIMHVCNASFVTPMCESCEDKLNISMLLYILSFQRMCCSSIPRASYSMKRI